MHRPGCDPENMTELDFMCDFCLATWTEENPFVEGHRGSLICSDCLTRAYRATELGDGATNVPEHVNCTLCLLHRDAPHWQSPIVEGGPVICASCVVSAAKMLEKDPASQWEKPVK